MISSGGYVNGCRIMFCRPAWALGVSTPRKPLMRPYFGSNASPISSWIILGLRFMVSGTPSKRIEGQRGVVDLHQARSGPLVWNEVP